MHWIQSFASFIERWSYDLPPKSETDFSDSLGGSWYISPSQHAIEFLTLAPMFIVLTLWSGSKVLNTKHVYKQLTTPSSTAKPSLVERSLFLLLVASLGLTVLHKAISGTMIFLMQPCHVSAFILILLQSWPADASPLIPQVLFNIYLHTMWGALLAFVFPDLRDRNMTGEIFNYFFEHGLLLVVPFYMAWKRRCVVLQRSKSMAIFSFFLYAAYHSPVLHVVSLISGFNLNFALEPPALSFIIMTGPWYRLIMYMCALALMFLTRYGLVEAVLFSLSHIQNAIATKRKVL